jgi:hypothetical protein
VATESGRNTVDGLHEGDDYSQSDGLHKAENYSQADGLHKAEDYSQAVSSHKVDNYSQADNHCREQIQIIDSHVCKYL